MLKLKQHLEPTPRSLAASGETHAAKSLLIVDDESLVVSSLKKIFERHYTVATALSGSDALAVLSGGYRPQVILADQRMPGMSGAEFLAESREIVPEAVRIILTGYTDIQDLSDSINLGKVYSFYTKPWNNSDLEEAIRLAFEHFELSEEKKHLQNALEEIRALNDEKTELMNIVSHDLKNPLGAIMGFGEIISNVKEFDISESDIRRIGGEITSASARMLELIKNLLDMNAVESGKIVMNIVTLCPTPILQSITDEYRHRAAEKNITLHCTADETMTVRASETYFHQVMDNLISNAVKYSPHGKRVYIDLARNGDSVHISVRDEGPGISPEDRKKMFGKFARLSAQPTGGEHSSGLGLSIVKKLVEAMHGTVWCESVAGQGATFIVELPTGEYTTP